MKSLNINIIRIPDDQNWMDVCDEEGMMIFAGRYGRPNMQPRLHHRQTLTCHSEPIRRLIWDRSLLILP